MATHTPSDNFSIDSHFLHITRRLRQITHAISKHSKHLQETYKLTLPQVLCLLEVHRQGSVTIGSLTRTVALNNSTITGIVDRLERDLLIRRVRTSRDRRQIHLEITEYGSEAVEKLPPPLDEGFMRRFAAQPPETQKHIIESLDQLAEMLNPSGVVDPNIVAGGIPGDNEQVL